MTAPIIGIDKPTMVPRRMKSRRRILPATNESMTSTWIGLFV